ncbi:hypothetical protein AB0891_25660 [Streptomyces sp. NPDC007259]|uniref:hypothetical protein n=1 Tax=Streptomyces sp. NPDC007259 TaxID=3154319 RepID=UPI0034549CB0
MDTQTTETSAVDTEAYPAVTQFKGRTIRYAPLSEGQAVALQALERDDDGKLAAGSFSVLLAVLEGCVGPDQWQRIRMDLARKHIEAADVVRLLMKIVDRAKRDGGKVSAA